MSAPGAEWTAERMELLCVRHGQTAWNAARRFQGQTDVPLDTEGRLQAAALAAHLRGVPIDRALSSDLSRARETAETILAGRGIDLGVEPRLREMRFGEWEGLDWSQITERHPDLPKDSWSDPRRYIPAGGESFEEVNARVGALVEELRASAGSEERILLVTHAGVLHSLFAVLRPAGLPPLRLRFATASLSRLRVTGSTTELRTLNEQPRLFPSPK